MSKPFVVVYSGVPGTSKTPVSMYLSITHNLPIINTDQIRYEVREDTRMKVVTSNKPAQAEFEKRLHARLRKLLESGNSFIYDGSVDRSWAELKSRFIEADYKWFMIDMELSRQFLLDLFNETDRQEFAQNHIDNYLDQHQAFLQKYEADIDLKITDQTFKDRLAVAAEALDTFKKTL